MTTNTHFQAATATNSSMAPKCGPHRGLTMSGPVHLHQTDDQGFPLCMCGPCRQKSILMNAMHINRAFANIFKLGADEQQEKLDRDQDYEGGMK